MRTITKLKSKVMRTAWELHRVSKLSFAECLTKAWQIIKDSFAKIQTVRIENISYWKSRRIEKTAQEINKEMIKNIVWYVDLFKRHIELKERQERTEKRNAEIRAKYNPVEADHMIYGTSLD